jgi:hypothetical protein
VDQRVSHRRRAPQAHDERIADAGSQAINDPAGDDEAQGIGELEGTDDVAVLLLVPANRMLQCGREDGQHLAIHVVDGGCGEEHGADGPANVAGARSRSLVLHRFDRGNPLRNGGDRAVGPACRKPQPAASSR